MKIPVTVYEKVLPNTHLGKLALYSPRTVSESTKLTNIGGELYLVSVV